MANTLTTNSTAKIDLFELERDARKLRAVEMARMGRNLRAGIANLISRILPGGFAIGSKHA